MNTPSIIEEIGQESLVTGGRRNFLRKMGLATAGTAGLIASASTARAQSPAPTAKPARFS